jgi:hypothetical protein
MNSALFKSELETFIEQHLPPELSEDWVAEILPRMTPNEELVIRYPSKSERDFEILAIISRFCEGVPSCLLRLFLENQRLPNLWEDIRAELDMPLDRLVLYLSRNFSERDFYGNFLPRVKKILTLTHLRRHFQLRARRLVRHRGYRDKGSLRPSHQWLPRNDWSLTELQNQIEEEREFNPIYFFFCGLGEPRVPANKGPTI